MTEHTFLVAVTVTAPDTMTRAEVERQLHPALPEPGTSLRADGVAVECWWVAEDDRHDGSDNDSAVFVSPGRQSEAHRLLADASLTPMHNDPSAYLGGGE